MADQRWLVAVLGAVVLLWILFLVIRAAVYQALRRFLHEASRSTEPLDTFTVPDGVDALAARLTPAPSANTPHPTDR